MSTINAESCPRCLTFYTASAGVKGSTPKILSKTIGGCGHTLCSWCITDMIKSDTRNTKLAQPAITCPICLRDITIPDGTPFSLFCFLFVDGGHSLTLEWLSFSPGRVSELPKNVQFLEAGKKAREMDRLEKTGGPDVPPSPELGQAEAPSSPPGAPNARLPARALVPDASEAPLPPPHAETFRRSSTLPTSSALAETSGVVSFRVTDLVKGVFKVRVGLDLDSAEVSSHKAGSILECIPANACLNSKGDVRVPLADGSGWVTGRIHDGRIFLESLDGYQGADIVRRWTQLALATPTGPSAPDHTRLVKSLSGPISAPMRSHRPTHTLGFSPSDLASIKLESGSVRTESSINIPPPPPKRERPPPPVSLPPSLPVVHEASPAVGHDAPPSTSTPVLSRERSARRTVEVDDRSDPARPHTSKRAISVAACDACADVHVALWFCPACDEHFCAEAADFHRRAKKYVTHVLESIGGLPAPAGATAAPARPATLPTAPTMCTTHPANEYKYFDEKCFIPLCIDCAVERHDQCKRMPIAQASAPLREALAATAAAAAASLTVLGDHVKVVDTALGKLTMQAEFAQAKLRREFDMVRGWCDSGRLTGLFCFWLCFCFLLSCSLPHVNAFFTRQVRATLAEREAALASELSTALASQRRILSAQLADAQAALARAAEVPQLAKEVSGLGDLDIVTHFSSLTARYGTIGP